MKSIKLSKIHEIASPAIRNDCLTQLNTLKPLSNLNGFKDYFYLLAFIADFIAFSTILQS